MSDPSGQRVSRILTSAIERGATAVHVEPSEVDVRVELLVDGQREEIMRLHRLLHRPLVGRLKNVAGMDQALWQWPQEGRILLRYHGAPVAFEVSLIPGPFGEAMTLRRVSSEPAR